MWPRERGRAECKRGKCGGRVRGVWAECEVWGPSVRGGPSARGGGAEGKGGGRGAY